MAVVTIGYSFVGGVASVTYVDRCATVCGFHCTGSNEAEAGSLAFEVT